MRKLFLLFITLCAVAISSAQSQRYVRISFSRTGQNITILKSNAIAADEIFVRNDDSLFLEVSLVDAERLKAAGLLFKTEIDDLSSFYAERSRGADLKAIRSSSALSGLTPVPEGFSLGSMGGFCTNSQMLAHLDTMHARFPNLITAREPISPITTHDGNQLYYVRISDNPTVNENEPSVLFTGLTHAREPIGMQQQLFFMYYLLENYDKDPYLKALIDTTQIYFIPCVNPDGYIYNQQTYPGGGGMWRKNRLDNGDGTYGVDLNRNFGYMWGYDDDGSSPYTFSETYRGESAFSEPETQAIRDFVNQNLFCISLNYHSYGNLLIYPFGYQIIETPDSVTFHDFAFRMSAFNGYSTGTSGQLLYNTNGDINDWLYGDDSQHPAVIGMTPEIGNSTDDGFWPSVDRIIPLCQENVPANMRVIELAGHYAEVSDESPMHLPQNEGYMHFSFVRQGLLAGGTYTVSYTTDESLGIQFGSPKVYTDPGRYDTISDSIWYQVDPSLAFPSQPVTFTISVSDGHITRSDTIHKIIGGQLTAILDDDCSNMDNWTSPNWNTTTFYAHSPATSITDSPVGNYPSNANRSIELSENLTVDPEKKPFAMISFWCRREIQRGHDYVVLEASADDGTTWSPLKGRYTIPGGPYQLLDAPIYDGIQDEWEYEEINLSDYALADKLKLRFILKSDALINLDGFWFDDLKVYTRDIFLGDNEPDGNQPGYSIASVWPNPASGNVQITLKTPSGEAGWLTVLSTVGQALFSEHIAPGQNNTTLNTGTLSAGVYTLALSNQSGAIVATRKLVVR